MYQGDGIALVNEKRGKLASRMTGAMGVMYICKIIASGTSGVQFFMVTLGRIRTSSTCPTQVSWSIFMRKYHIPSPEDIALA